MVLSLSGEAVAAGQVAVVGDVQAQGLHHRLPGLEIPHEVLIAVLGEELLAVDELLHDLQDLLNLLTGEFPSEPLPDGLFHLLRNGTWLLQLADQGLRDGDSLVKCRICHVDGAGVHVHDNGNSVVDKLMDQSLLPLSSSLSPSRHGRKPAFLPVGLRLPRGMSSRREPELHRGLVSDRQTMQQPLQS